MGSGPGRDGRPGRRPGRRTGRSPAGDRAGPDFDNDGFGDLAVGAPGEDVGDVPDAGVVNVRFAPGFGGPVGLRRPTQDRPEAGDCFGAALAHGSIDPVGGYADLAVGAPGETVDGRAGAVAVSLVLAGASGFSSEGAQLLHQGAGGVPGAAEAGDGFGAALSGRFFLETDVLEDLGIGAPGERVGGTAGAGAVSVRFSSGPDGLGGAGRQFLYQGPGLPGTAEAGDALAAALAGTTG